MKSAVSSAIDRLLDHHDLSPQEMQEAVSEIMDGVTDPIQIAALLTAMRLKGETVDEIVGAARAMQQRATPIRSSHSRLLDTCGTGGDALHTFNISTAAALVAAAAGVPVAKHGNRSVSSTSGSADVLEALDVNINLTPDEVSACLDELGIGFCFAPLFHGAMKHVAPVRKQLGIRTIFNLLGPLTNPAGAEYQLIGANRNATAEKLARALAQLGRRKALVVCGADELDEVCLWGETVVFTVVGDKVSSESWTPQDLGLKNCRVEELQVHSAEESAAVIRGVFDGQTGPARDMVLANSGAALLAAERTDNVRAGIELAAQTIDSGKAATLCSRLAEITAR